VDETEILKHQQRRLKYYAEPVIDVSVPDPAGSLTSVEAKDTRKPVLVVLVCFLGLVYFGNMIDVSERTGHDLLAQICYVAMAGCVVAVPLLIWYARKRSGHVDLDGPLARPWLDLREGLRLGSVEPANPAWGEAITRASRMQTLMRLASGTGKVFPHSMRDEVQEIGSRVWAISEVWRREQAALAYQRAVSPLDRLPPRIGPSALDASHASDAAADAATRALGMGEYDLDFEAYARRRAAMYARKSGTDTLVPDPREALAVDLGQGPPEIYTKMGCATFLVSGTAACALLVLEEPVWSFAAAVPALVSIATTMLLPDAGPQLQPVLMAPGPAMAWADYLDSVAYADSGAAAVTTVEAIRGGEQRVRAILLELTEGTASQVEREPMERELYRLCSQAWTLVGQERAESRLLNEPPRDGLTP
jgi:hypothetical protein